MQAPAAPQVPVIVQIPGAGAGGSPRVVTTGGPGAIYEGFRNQRTELRNQLERLLDQRNDISSSLQDPMVGGANRAGLEQRITAIDARVADVEKQIAVADANVAQAASIPGAIVERPPVQRSGVPDEVWVLTGIFMFIVILPLTIAYARRIWRRGAAAVMSIPQEIYDRFTRLDQAVDAVAIEVERIGEGQRFLTKIQTEQRSLGPGPAERVEIGERERQPERKRV